MNKRQIAFTADKNGTPIAYRFCVRGFRWFRMSYDEAKIQVATGQARQVAFVKVGR